MGHCWEAAVLLVDVRKLSPAPQCCKYTVQGTNGQWTQHLLVGVVSLQHSQEELPFRLTLHVVTALATLLDSRVLEGHSSVSYPDDCSPSNGAIRSRSNMPFKLIFLPCRGFCHEHAVA